MKAANKKLLFTLIGIGVVLDQLTKAWALNYLEDSPKFLGETDIGLSLAFNSGSAFSLFENYTLLLTIAGTIIFGVLIYLIYNQDNFFVALSYAFIASGALGNLVDRFTQEPGLGRGHVVDFIKIDSWPTFNLADSFITIGIILLVVFSLFFQGKYAKA